MIEMMTEVFAFVRKMISNGYVIAFFILFATGADAVRDAWMSRYRKDPYKSSGWKKRHRAKWAAFYPPLLVLMFLHISPWGWIPLGGLAYVVYRHVSLDTSASVVQDRHFRG